MNSKLSIARLRVKLLSTIAELIDCLLSEDAESKDLVLAVPVK